jgi:hypothetical protein
LERDQGRADGQFCFTRADSWVFDALRAIGKWLAFEAKLNLE